MNSKILIVEDDKIVRESLVTLLTKDGYEISAVSDGPDALELLQKQVFDAIILDINLPTMDGLEVLNRIKRIQDAPPVIMLTAHGSVQNAVAAMKSGAFDFLLKPCPPKELKSVLNNILSRSKNDVSHGKIGTKSDNSVVIVGESAPMKKIMELVKKVAVTDANVFIFGETGTGKDLIARAVHNNSKRKEEPFIKIDCAVLPIELLESELFGHEQGAFTGAKERFIGKFEQADGGTVFLDEISNLTLVVQSKLLNVTQDREFTRLKGSTKIKINIRIISASNKELTHSIKDGKFREDLFYRLDVVGITLPPLRERKEDIPLLCNYFLNKFNKINQRNVKGIEPEALGLLTNYQWPGNVRELENLMEQLVVMIDSDIIKVSDLPSKITQFTLVAFGSESSQPSSLKESQKSSEIDMIIDALNKAGGNKKKAADILKISRVSLYNKIKEHNIKL